MFRLARFAILSLCLLGCQCGTAPPETHSLAALSMDDAGMGSPDMAQPRDLSTPPDLTTPPDLSLPVKVVIPNGMIASSPDMAYCFFRYCTLRFTGWRSPKEPQAAKNIAAILGYDLVLLNNACAWVNSQPAVGDPPVPYTLDMYFKDLSGAADPWTKMYKCDPTRNAFPIQCMRQGYNLPNWRQTYDYFVPPRNSDKGTAMLCAKYQIIPY